MKNNIQVWLDNARSALNNGRIKAAINNLDKSARELNSWDLVHSLSEISDNYGYMCRFFLRGVPDDNKSAIVADMTSRLETMLEELKRETAVNNESVYSSEVRFTRIRNTPLSDLIHQYESLIPQFQMAEESDNMPSPLARRRFQLLEDIFRTTLVTFNKQEEYNLIEHTLLNENSDYFLQVQLIYALTLGLFAWFNPDAADVLLSVATNSPDSHLSKKALVSIILLIKTRSKEIKRNAKLTEKINTLLDIPELMEGFRYTIRAIAATIDTERIAKKMKNEVMPEIIKLQPEFLKKMKDFSSDSEDSELNPAWQELMDESGITKKMEEINEMISSETDIMMMSFAHLKQLPFFQKINNWFLPFNINNPEITYSPELKLFIRRLSSINSKACDSDLYSLALAFSRIPEAQRNLMVNNLEAQSEQLKEAESEVKADILENRTSKHNDILLTVRDYYRFFSLSNRTKGFINPFNNQYEFIELVPGSVFSNSEFQQIMAEYYMKRAQYKEALAIFKGIADAKPTDYTVWQKIGFALQKSGDLQGALSSYMKAELFGDNSNWLTKKLAYVNKKLGKYDVALEYYNRLLETDPDNIKYISRVADLEIALNRYDDALKNLFHAHYIDYSNRKVATDLAWIELLKGNIDKSNKRFIDLLNEEASAADWINAGHSEFLLGNNSKAREYYRMSYDMDRGAFELKYTTDIDILKKHGLDDISINMMLESVIENIL